MHDPMTVAFEIKSPIRRRYKSGGEYRNTLVTVWHVDPERDGSDDSCDWFGGRRWTQRQTETFERIARAFEFEARSGVPFGWFDDEGNPNYSVRSIVQSMFLIAANEHFGHWSKASKRFLRRHLFDILHFAENSCDSLWSNITRHYERRHAEPEKRKERMRGLARCVYGWILRAERPWYRHPRWHFWHWHIQIHPLQSLRRWLLTRCEKCGERFKRGEPVIGTSWSSPPKRWFESFRGERGCVHDRCGGHVVRSDTPQ